MDASLEVVAGRYQLDIQQAMANLAAQVPYEIAHTLLGDLTGVQVSVERMHTLTNALADGLSVLDVAPDAEEIRTRMQALQGSHRRRPVMVLAIDGAHVPTRPEEAAALIDAPKRWRTRRSRWKGGYREAKGLRLYGFNADRIVHLLSWYQIEDDNALGQTLDHLQEAGLIPENEGDYSKDTGSCSSCSGLVKGFKGLFTPFTLGFAPQVECNSCLDLIVGTHTVETFLHLTITSIA